MKVSGFSTRARGNSPTLGALSGLVGSNLLSNKPNTYFITKKFIAIIEYTRV